MIKFKTLLKKELFEQLKGKYPLKLSELPVRWLRK